MKTHIEILAEFDGDPAGYININEALKAMKQAVEQANGWISVEEAKKYKTTKVFLGSHIEDKWVHEVYYDGTDWYNSEDINKECPVYPTHYRHKPAPPIK